MNGFVQGDPALCIGCGACMVGCVAAHEGRSIFHADPDGYDFHPKLKVVKTINVSVPVLCKHCENPECMSVCRAGAITRQDGAVIINQDKCIGCKACSEACSFGAIEIVQLLDQTNPDNSQKSVANKCDQCRDASGGPACIEVCPTSALRFVSEDNMTDEIIRKRQQAIRVCKA